jgi:type VI secretion system protein ImpH
VDLTTGNERYAEGMNELLIKIGPVTSEVFHQFRPGETKHKILELLMDYLLPVHLDMVTEFELYEIDRTIKLADERNQFNSVLGTDTYL